MRLTRLDELVSYELDGRRFTGMRGLLVIGPVAWHTIENWDVDTKLIPGSYECEFAWWTARSGVRSQAIRILLTEDQFERIYPEQRRDELIRTVGSNRARGRLYIHSANRPDQLAGCIAPGLRPVARGVERSRQAIEQVFRAAGGWAEGRRIVGGLEVL